jgi:hypothetical protein
LGGFGGAGGEFADFVGDYGKPAGGFNCGVEREQIGLFRRYSTLNGVRPLWSLRWASSAAKALSLSSGCRREAQLSARENVY